MISNNNLLISIFVLQIRQNMAYKKRIITCPKGEHTDNIIPILYGEATHEAYEKSLLGKLRLGGCCIEDNSPKHYCKTHKIEF
jgi:hypothetical protein